MFNNCDRNNEVVKSGPIMGNPLNGMNEIVNIQVNKIHDSCMCKVLQAQYDVIISDLVPSELDYPYEYVDIVVAGECKITDLTIKKLVDKSRVQFNCIIPVNIAIKDSKGVDGVCVGAITIHKDLLLSIPQEALAPYNIQISCTIEGQSGIFTSANKASISLCAILLVKVIVPVEILVPSYGYNNYEECREFNDDKCKKMFDLPIFPKS